MREYTKCPKCGMEIGHLKEIREERNTYEVWPSNDGKRLEYDLEDNLCIVSSTFYCPECNEEISGSEEEVEELFS